MTNESGQVVAGYEYDPYGNPIGRQESGYGYTGEFWQSELGLLHLRARWYDPNTATFLSKDTLESEHPYGYVRGNPVNYVDPSGHCYGPARFERSLPGGEMLCGNLDMANQIAGDPRASMSQRLQASAYQSLMWTSHAGLAVGAAFGGKVADAASLAWSSGTTAYDLYRLSQAENECEQSEIKRDLAFDLLSVGVDGAVLVIPWMTGGGQASKQMVTRGNTLYRSIGKEVLGETSLFDPQKLKRILKILEEEGFSVIRGEKAEKILKDNAAEALYWPLPGQPGILVLPDNPSKSAVIEELIHIGQHRLRGWEHANEYQRLINEVRAQRYLLDNAKRLGLTPKEISDIKIAQDLHFGELNDLLKGK